MNSESILRMCGIQQIKQINYDTRVYLQHIMVKKNREYINTPKQLIKQQEISNKLVIKRGNTINSKELYLTY